MVDRFRFAPSPTGFLHVGSARAALFNWLEARRTGAELVLRIEDTDTERSRPELVEHIYEVLDWLGLDWDGEPVLQSSRIDAHRDAAGRLAAAQAAYWCDCTADDVAARGGGGYDGHCRERGLQRGPGRALRFRVPEGRTSWNDLVRGEVTFDHQHLEDFVVLRANGTPTFLVANAVDDADMGITHVVRGEDLVNATPKYLLIRHALGVEERPVLAHLPILVNEARKKLSKRRDSVAVEEFRAQGFLPEAMVNYLALLGWGPRDGVEVRPVSEVVELFRLSDVSPAPAFFDVTKLTHFNGEYIRRLSPEAFLDAVEPFLSVPERSRRPLRALAPAVQERVKTLAEAESVVDFLYLEEPEVDEDDWAAVVGNDPERAARVLDEASEAFGSVDWEADALNAALFETVRDRLDGLGKSKLQAPVRIAVTGRRVGPPLFESLEALGREETLARLAAARDRIE